jgi:hypothetical protein
MIVWIGVQPRIVLDRMIPTLDALTLRARQVADGQQVADQRVLDRPELETKHEILSTKSETNAKSKTQNPKQATNHAMFRTLRFRNLDLFRISDFGFRI